MESLDPVYIYILGTLGNVCIAFANERRARWVYLTEKLRRRKDE